MRTVRGGIIPVRRGWYKSSELRLLPDMSVKRRPMPDFSAACFDLDGTLIDTTPLHLAAEAETLREFGIDPGDPRRPWTFGLGDEAGMKLLADAFELDRERVMKAYVPRWWDAVETGADLKPGAENVLSLLLEMKVPAALVTSGDSRYVEIMFESCGLSKFFAATVSMDDVDRMKPDPEPYVTAAGRLGFKPTSCVGFEDSPAGLASLRSAGMFSVSVVGNPPPGECDLSVAGLDHVTPAMLAAWFGA